MNEIIALSIAKTFLVWNFTKMNEGIHWGYGCKHFMDDTKPFQEICDQKYNGDLDESLNDFFKNIMNNKDWCTIWLYEMGFTMAFDNPLDDVKYVCDTLSKYLNECSINDLREVLDLNDYLK